MAAGQDDLTKRELQPARMLNFVGISRYLDSIRTKVNQGHVLRIESSNPCLRFPNL